MAVGVIRTNPDMPMSARLRELYRDVASVLGEHAPDVVALEQVFVNKNLQTAMSVARASGVIMLAAAEVGVPVVEYTPSSVKAAIAGYGSAPKEQVQKMVATRLRLATAPRPADAADALAIALCHIQSHRLSQSGTTSRVEDAPTTKATVWSGAPQHKAAASTTADTRSAGR